MLSMAALVSVYNLLILASRSSACLCLVLGSWAYLASMSAWSCMSSLAQGVRVFMATTLGYRVSKFERTASSSAVKDDVVLRFLIAVFVCSYNSSNLVCVLP